MQRLPFPTKTRTLFISDYKRIIIYVLILILAVAGHYFLMQIPMELFREIRKVIISMLSMLCLGGSFILITRKNGGRARTLFTFAMFLCGLTNLLSVIRGFTSGYAGMVEYKFLSMPMLVYGSVYAYIFLLYPIEGFRPGWLTVRRAIILFLPTIVIPAIYLLVVKLHNVPSPVINGHTALSHDFWNYNVWIPMLILFYPVFGLVVMLRYRNNYKKWCEDNYASMENIDIKWLEDYIFANLIITISAQVVVLSDNVRSVLMHNIIFLIFFLYGFYRVLFQESPYPKGYFRTGMDETEAEVREAVEIEAECKEEAIQKNVLVAENNPNTKYMFAEKLPEYMSKLEQWMQTEKPYICKDFKLLDAMEILPLNRSYLSRLFNEGYSESFYQFVMRYRIAESKHLLLTRSDLNISSIAHLSGFSSPSVFCRAFVQATNCSPMQWREREMVR